MPSPLEDWELKSAARIRVLDGEKKRTKTELMEAIKKDIGDRYKSTALPASQWNDHLKRIFKTAFPKRALPTTFAIYFDKDKQSQLLRTSPGIFVAERYATAEQKASARAEFNRRRNAGIARAAARARREANAAVVVRNVTSGSINTGETYNAKIGKGLQQTISRKKIYYKPGTGKFFYVITEGTKQMKKEVPMSGLNTQLKTKLMSIKNRTNAS